MNKSGAFLIGLLSNLDFTGSLAQNVSFDNRQKEPAKKNTLKSATETVVLRRKRDDDKKDSAESDSRKR